MVLGQQHNRCYIRHTGGGQPLPIQPTQFDPNQPLRLRAIFLDAGIGKVKSTQAWPSESRIAGIVAANNGKFVTQAGTTLTLYSSDAKELKNLLLPPPPNEFVGWQAHPSPTGKSVLFMTNEYMATSAKMWHGSSYSLRFFAHREIVTGWMGISDSNRRITACLLWSTTDDLNVEMRDLYAAGCIDRSTD